MSQTKIKAGGFDVDVITGTTALAEAPASTDEFLISDGGVLKRLDASHIGGDNTPAFHVYRSSAQTGLSNGTNTKIQFNAEFLDTDNAFDSSTNYRFTPQTAGKYFFYLQVLLSSAANNDNIEYCYSEIKKNGSPITFAMLDYRSSRAGRKMTILNHIIVDMNGSSDYVEGWGELSTNVTGDNQFGGHANGSETFFGGYKLITWVI